MDPSRFLLIGFKMCMILVFREVTTYFSNSYSKAQSHNCHPEIVPLLWLFNKRKVTREHTVQNIIFLWVMSYLQRANNLQIATEISKRPISRSNWVMLSICIPICVTTSNRLLKKASLQGFFKLEQ